MLYPAIKAMHLISMVAWFAGLFYIFRLFVYHRNRCHSEEACELLGIMETKLLRYIVLPASIATICFGIWLLTLNPALLSRSWLWGKLLLVAALLGYQALAWHTRRMFSLGNFYLSERACRAINEVPTLLLIGIVFLAVLKPWG
jgi:putative membrane protein